MKKVLLSSGVVACTLLGLGTITTAFADTTTQQSATTTSVAPGSSTANSSVGQPVSPSLTLSPNAISQNYHLPGVPQNNVWQSPFDFTVPAESSGETASVNLVQWESNGTEADAQYRLVSTDGSATPWHRVTGTYTSSDAWVYFTDMLSGTYYLQVENLAPSDLDGNGYVHY
ncbi:hypothetical protein [Alicyclobacillus acidiphilus]|uniref:hypothetical protein n=1 Tax=Alicyclobacillus acidiphilus TaxID=182455 RepID=UPI0008315D4B|nr:hypothetical protein [Alicyclobacillus acidiphilus]